MTDRPDFPRPSDARWTPVGHLADGTQLHVSHLASAPLLDRIDADLDAQHRYAADRLRPLDMHPDRDEDADPLDPADLLHAAFNGSPTIVLDGLTDPPAAGYHDPDDRPGTLDARTLDTRTLDVRALDTSLTVTTKSIATETIARAFGVPLDLLVGSEERRTALTIEQEREVADLPPAPPEPRGWAAVVAAVTGSYRRAQRRHDVAVGAWHAAGCPTRTETLRTHLPSATLDESTASGSGITWTARAAR